MSRSEPNNIPQNPASKFFDWAGSEGKLVYYDKEQKINVPVELPFRFLVLDEVATVGGGFDDGNNYVGYWSNAIRPMKAKLSPFTVRSTVNKKTRVEFEGLWADVKGHLTGAKYIKGLYIAYYNDEGDLDVGYLKIRGASAMTWRETIEDAKQDIYKGAFSITGSEKRKKGTNNFFVPTFTHTDNVKDETNASALALDSDILQPYLKQYFEYQEHREPDANAYTGTDESHGDAWEEEAPDYVQDAQSDPNEDTPF